MEEILYWDKSGSNKLKLTILRTAIADNIYESNNKIEIMLLDFIKKLFENLFKNYKPNRFNSSESTLTEC